MSEIHVDEKNIAPSQLKVASNIYCGSIHRVQIFNKYSNTFLTMYLIFIGGIKCNISKTDCANNGSFVSVQFVRVGCRQDIAVHTCSIHQNACKTLLLQGTIHFRVHMLRDSHCNEFLSKKMTIFICHT